MNIGAKVKELGADLFGSATGVSRVNIANWADWFNNVKLGNLNSNPYRFGNTEIYVAGMRFTTMEIPQNATEIPDYKMAGLKYEGELVLPEGVKRIGHNAFANNADLYYVTFPDGLEEIGDHAFDGCASMRFEALPAALKTIGEYAFTQCDLLESITLPETVETIGEGAFSSMKGLTKAVLFSNVTELPAKCLAYNPVLNKVYLPKQLETIGDRAFHESNHLEEITLPESVTSIGDWAFDCSMKFDGNGISKINFPSSLTHIGEYAFCGTGLTSIELPASLENIGKASFSILRNLFSISFSDGLKTIGEYAFGSSSSSRLNITLPNSVTSLAKAAFADCGLGEVTIGDNVTELPANSLGRPAVLNIGAGVKKMSGKAFDATDLRVLRVKTNTPPTLTEKFNFADEVYDKIILVVNDGKADAFKRNPNWEKFNIVEESKSAITIFMSGDYPISEEIRMQAGLMPSTVVKMTVTGHLSDTDFRLIRENMLSLYSLDLSGIDNTTIPERALSEMPNLVELKLPAKLTAIPDYAFFHNKLMDVPAIPETVESIGQWAFGGCERLSITKLPDALRTMGKCALDGCNSLREITAGENLEEIGAYSVNENGYGSDGGTFAYCAMLEFVDLSKTNITTIHSGEFMQCPNLTTVLLPNSVSTIGDEAFENTGLDYIELPEALTSIDKLAFANSKLRTMVVPEKVAIVKDNAFENNPRLTSVTFPGALQSIGTNVFSGSSKLAAISCSAINAPVAATGAFNGIRATKCSLTVPQQSFRNYLNAPQWGMFSELFNRIVVEIPEDVEVTCVPEEEYQEILEEENLNEEMNAPVEEEEKQPANVRRAARRRAAQNILDGRSFARLFDGAMLGSSSSSKGTRVFVNVKENSELVSVIYNGVDIKDQMVGNSVLVPGVANGSLKIVTRIIDAGVEDVTLGAEAATGLCDVYDLQGHLRFTGDRADVETALPAGIYVVRTATATEKVVIR
ncbi:MAG: leucine-rich repeat domain-containing protein [[Clostridium] fimetarium]|nr:leucine-rich repeat domain-containing protein [[Clostridium] fimetarium]